MDFEQITITTQIITGLSTMLLAIFLLRQLRLQHKDSVTNLRLTIGTQVDDMFRSMYTDRDFANVFLLGCLLYTSPSPRDRQKSRMPSSA